MSKANQIKAGRLLTVAALLAGTAPVAVQAQSLADSDADIVVTAQRRSESLQKVPVSVAVVSAESIERQNIRTLEELGARQANVKIAPGGASDQLHIRGVGSGFNAGFEQSVATFVDGVYRSRSRSSRIALFDVERVEILKGPQTTFFGANAIAGALNITSKKPGRDFALNASALYAPADGEYSYEGGISAPLGETLSGRVSTKFSGMDGYIYNNRLDTDAPHLRDWQGRVALAWEPRDDFSLDLRFDMARLRGKNNYSTEIVGCPPPDRAAAGICARTLNIVGDFDDELNYRTDAPPHGSRINYYELAITPRWQIGDHTLTAITAWIRQNAAVIPSNTSFPGLSAFGTQAYQWIRVGEDGDQFSQELRLESPTGGFLNYQVGLYYDTTDTDFSTKFAYFAQPVGGNAAPYLSAADRIGADVHVTQKTETRSAFGSVTANFTDALRLSLGLRYSSVSKRARRHVVIGTRAGEPDYEPLTPAPLIAQQMLEGPLAMPMADYPINRRVDSKWMPSANLQYNVTPDAMVYGSYARGFKAGGFGSTTRDVFGPEHVDNFEVGLKASWLNRRITTNIALFTSNYTDLQETTNTTTAAGGILSVVNNVASMRSRGVEFEGRARMTDHFVLSLGVAYLDSRYKSYPNAPCTPVQLVGNPTCRQALSGRRRAFAPEWSGSVGADFDAMLTDSLQLRLGSTLAFNSSYYLQTNLDPLARQEGYSKLDLRAAVGPEDRKWELAVIGKNVTDKATSLVRVGTPGAAGTTSVLLDRPRSIAVQLSTRW